MDWTAKELNHTSVPGGGKRFCLLQSIQTSLWPIQPHIQWLRGGSFCRCESAIGIKLNIHLYQVARLKMGGTKPLLPAYALRHSQGQLYL